MCTLYLDNSCYLGMCFEYISCRAICLYLLILGQFYCFKISHIASARDRREIYTNVIRIILPKKWGCYLVYLSHFVYDSLILFSQFLESICQ